MANPNLTNVDPQSEWEKKLDEFFHAMKQQIMLNSHKGMRDAWLSNPLEDQVISIKINTQELRTALAYGVDVLDKAADVAVWSFFVWDNFANNSKWGPEGRTTPPDKRFTGE